MELKVREVHIPEGWHEVTVEELKAPTDNALSTGPFGSSIGSRFFGCMRYLLYVMDIRA